MSVAGTGSSAKPHSSAYGGSLTYDYSFNVEELYGRVWEKSETDIYPADKPMM